MIYEYNLKLNTAIENKTEIIFITKHLYIYCNLTLYLWSKSKQYHEFQILRYSYNVYVDLSLYNTTPRMSFTHILAGKWNKT